MLQVSKWICLKMGDTHVQLLFHREDCHHKLEDLRVSHGFPLNSQTNPNHYDPTCHMSWIQGVGRVAPAMKKSPGLRPGTRNWLGNQTWRFLGNPIRKIHIGKSRKKLKIDGWENHPVENFPASHGDEKTMFDWRVDESLIRSCSNSEHRTTERGRVRKQPELVVYCVSDLMQVWKSRNSPSISHLWHHDPVWEAPTLLPWTTLFRSSEGTHTVFSIGIPQMRNKPFLSLFYPTWPLAEELKVCN